MIPSTTTSFPLVFTSHFSHPFKKRPRPPQHPREHAQSLPHSDGHGHACCILTPPCTDAARGDHTQASTARKPRTQSMLGVETHARCRPPLVASGREVGWRKSSSLFSFFTDFLNVFYQIHQLSIVLPVPFQKTTDNYLGIGAASPPPFLSPTAPLLKHYFTTDHKRKTCFIVDMLIGPSLSSVFHVL